MGIYPLRVEGRRGGVIRERLTTSGQNDLRHRWRERPPPFGWFASALMDLAVLLEFDVMHVGSP